MVLNKNEVIENLKKKGVEAQLVEVSKNGVNLTGIRPVNNQAKVLPTVYLENLRATDPESAADEIIEIFNAEVPEIDITFLTKFDEVKNSLVASVCGHGKEDLPHIEKLDLDIFARIQVENGFIKVTEEMVKSWKVSFDEVIGIALFNSFEKCTARTIEEVLGFGVPELSKMFVISNTENLFGACNIFNTMKLSEVAEKLESDLYILPSSIHEVITVEASNEARMLAEMVHEVNRNEVDPTEVLTDSVYHFSREEKRLTVVSL